jgi:predicted ATPase
LPNPFFIEELVKALFKQGTLIRDGGARLVEPLAEMKVPPTVQGVLASRIDRLPAAEKELLQVLAVIGKHFPLGLVRAVSRSSDDELNRMLRSLQDVNLFTNVPRCPMWNTPSSTA